MSTSKAIVVKKFGDCSSTVIEDFPLPPIEGRIEVEVHYCGINFSDLYMRLGFFKRELPFVLGSECTGIIKNIGTDTDDFKVGQHVICYDYTGGLYRPIVRVLPKQVFILPDDIPLDIGASIFVNYLTAYFALCELGNLKSNESVLINSCAGGVGWAATQLAKTAENVKIYGTTSKAKEDIVKDNGVDEVFPYENLESNLRKVEPHGIDIILENQSGNSLHENINLLKPLGRMILLGINSAINNSKLSYTTLLKMWWKSWWFSLTDLVTKNRSISGLHLGTLLENDRAKVVHALNYMFTLWKDGKIEPKIDSVWSIEKYSEATKRIAERKNVGKVLIKMI